jgi:hypothetical protein
MPDSLWPDDIGKSALVTPVSILKEQASALGTATQQLVKGEVETDTRGNQFVHHFNLVVPTLSNYTYELLTVQHSIELYPVYANSPKISGVTERIENQDDLKEWLKMVFASEKTRSVVQSLIAQARS